MIAIDHLDHLVLTVASLERSCDFYARALGMTVERFAEGRTALRFGRQKINLHLAGHELEPKAARPTPGSADLCFVLTTSLDEAARHLAALRIPIEQGPVARTGATGPILSLYVRDPDQNLIEISSPTAPVKI